MSCVGMEELKFASLAREGDIEVCTSSLCDECIHENDDGETRHELKYDRNHAA